MSLFAGLRVGLVTAHQGTTYLVGSDFQQITLASGVRSAAGATGTGAAAASTNMILVGAAVGVKPQ